MRALEAQGQFDLAIGKTEQALRLLSEAYGSEHEYAGHVHDHLATLHYRAGRLETAFAHAQQAARIREKDRAATPAGSPRALPCWPNCA